MLRFALAFAGLALFAGVLAFSPVPAGLAGLAKMALFAFLLLAAISTAAHLSFERRPRTAPTEDSSEALGRGPLDR